MFVSDIVLSEIISCIVVLVVVSMKKTGLVIVEIY